MGKYGKAAWWENLRPEVQQFAMAMETRLRANDHKGPWPPPLEGFGMAERIGGVMEEFAELYYAAMADNPVCSDVYFEAADVANFAMIAWMAAAGGDPMGARVERDVTSAAELAALVTRAETAEARVSALTEALRYASDQIAQARNLWGEWPVRGDDPEERIDAALADTETGGET